MALLFSSLASGSSGNCQLIKSAQTTLLLDCGVTGKYVTRALGHFDIATGDVDGIVITHEHSDHIAGLGVLHRKSNLPIYINAATWQAVAPKIGKVAADKVHIIDNKETFQIGDIAVTPYRVSHDAVDPVCYSFANKDAKIVVATDLGEMNDRVLEALKTANLVMVEANHNVEMVMSGRYPYPLKRRVVGNQGHLSNENCALAAIEAVQRGSVSTVLLAHLSRENNTPELAYETVKSLMAEEDIVVGKDVMLELTYRNRVGNYYRLGSK